MNIIKCKKLIMTTLIFVMFMALVQPPLLTAKERRGATVVVTMIDGSQVKGELLAVKADALLIYNSKGERLDLQQVIQVKVLKESKFGEGVLIGMGVGLGISLFSKLINDPTSHHSGYGDAFLIGAVVAAPITGLCGGLIGASAGIDKKFSLDGISSYDMQQNLEQLKHYAREQDFEEPAAK